MESGRGIGVCVYAEWTGRFDEVGFRRMPEVEGGNRVALGSHGPSVGTMTIGRWSQIAGVRMRVRLRKRGVSPRRPTCSRPCRRSVYYYPAERMFWPAGGTCGGRWRAKNRCGVIGKGAHQGIDERRSGGVAHTGRAGWGARRGSASGAPTTTTTAGADRFASGPIASSVGGPDVALYAAQICATLSRG